MKHLLIKLFEYSLQFRSARDTCDLIKVQTKEIYNLFISYDNRKKCNILFSLFYVIYLLVYIFIPEMRSQVSMLFSIAFLFGVANFIFEVCELAKKYQSILVIFTTLVLGFIFIFTQVITRTWINNTTRVDPAQFSFFTQSLAIIISIALLWPFFIKILIIILTIISICLFVSLQYYIIIGRFLEKNCNIWIGRASFNQIKSTTKISAEEIFKFLQDIGRFGIIICIIFVYINNTSLFSLDIQIIERYSVSALAHMEYNLVSDECNNYTYSSGERIKILGDGKISVAVPNGEKGFLFETRSCMDDLP